MNWLVLYLPIITSLSLTVGSILLFLFSKNVYEGVKVPEIREKEIPMEKVVDAFSKVFPKTEVRKTTSPKIPVSLGTEVKLLGTSVGFKNLALLNIGGKPTILEEGREKEGIFLERVYRDRVVVRINGSRIELLLEKRKAETGPARTPVEAGEVRISRREIERITKDPGIMFREIRLVPYVRNGRTEGFIFEWIKPGSLFYRAGLRKGDVLVSINNMTIRSGEDAFRLLQVLRNEPSLRVVVLRNGRRKEINVRIE